MSVVNHYIGETASPVEPIRPDYITSEQKAEFDARIAGRVLPLVKASLAITELAVHGSFGADHYYAEERFG